MIKRIGYLCKDTTKTSTDHDSEEIQQFSYLLEFLFIISIYMNSVHSYLFITNSYPGKKGGV